MGRFPLDIRLSLWPFVVSLLYCETDPIILVVWAATSISRESMLNELRRG
jgi:hypothetical protein